MAINKEIWDKAKALLELGKSLGDISIELGIDKGGLSKKAKKFNWIQGKNQQLKSDVIEIENEISTLEAKKSTLAEKISTLDDFDITIFNEVVESELKRKSILFSTANLSLIRKNQLLTKNTRQVVEYETVYDENGKPLSKKPISLDIELSPSDLKAIDEGIETNAKSLELAPRFAPKQDINLNNNNQTTENKVIEVIFK